MHKTIVLDTQDYFIRLLSTPRWIGGNKAILKFEVEVSKKGVIDFESIKGPTQEIFDVELVSASSDYYDMNRPEFERRDDLVLRWYPRREIGDSMLFFSNTLILKQLGIAVGIPFGVVAIIIGITSGKSIYTLYALSLIFAVLLFTWLFILIFYKGKYEAEFVLNGKLSISGAVYFDECGCEMIRFSTHSHLKATERYYLHGLQLFPELKSCL